jgi:RNA polymerase sigma-70 factor (ECF subfamily)
MEEQPSEYPLRKALDGDIHAFQSMFSAFHGQLKSYLYRLLANRNDAEDLAHDTFIKAFDHLSAFKGESSLKTWVFQIATSFAYNHLKRRRRWTEDVSQKAKELVLANEGLRREITQVHSSSPLASYAIREHIDTCFTCMAKTLAIEQPVALMLKDIYDFTVPEICQILHKTEGVVKYLLQQGRKTLTTVFDWRCALVIKKGVCHQCSELNGWFNPRQSTQEALMQLDLVKESGKHDRETLYKMRAPLVKAIDPLTAEGAELQEILLRCNRMAMGEENTN